MSGAPERCALHGFVNPVALVPAFVVPVFTSERSNRLFVQQIDPDDRIAAFHALDLGEHELRRCNDSRTVEVGAPALWAFQHDDERCVIEPRYRLGQEIEAVDLTALPVLGLQVARFLGRDVVPAIGRCYRHLAALSAATAQAWRDLVILTPELRRSLGQLLSGLPVAQRDIASLLASVQGDRLDLHMTARLIEALGGEALVQEAVRGHAGLFAELEVARLSIRETAERDVGAQQDRPIRPHPKISLIAIGSIAGNVASSAAKSAGIKFIPGDRVFTDEGKLRPSVGAEAGAFFVVVAEEDDKSISSTLRLIQSLVGRHSHAGAIIIRKTNSRSGEGEDRSLDLEERFEELARSSHWLAFVGGAALLRGGRVGPVRGAEPLNTSPSNLLKWGMNAMAAAVASPEGRSLLELLFKKRRTPKLAAIGSGASSASRAASIAAEAAFISLAKARPHLDRPSALGVAIFRGAKTPDTVAADVAEIVRQRAPGVETSMIEVVRPGLGATVRVVLLGRGNIGLEESWRGPSHLVEFEDKGWRYGHHLPEIDVLDVLISKGEAEFALRSELEREVLSFADADEIIGSTPMYRGPVALLLNTKPAAEVVRYLLTAGIFCVVRGEVEALESYGPRPFAAMRDELLTLTRPEACHHLRFVIRDLVWVELSIDRRRIFSVDAAWLDESYPDQVQVDVLELYRITDSKTLFFRGHCTATPYAEQKGNSVELSFWLTMDDEGIRVTRMMTGTRRGPVEIRL